MKAILISLALLLNTANARATTLYFSFTGTLTSNAFDYFDLFADGSHIDQAYELFITANTTDQWLGTNPPGGWLAGQGAAVLTIGNYGVEMFGGTNIVNVGTNAFAVPHGGYLGDGGLFEWNDTNTRLQQDFVPMPVLQLTPYTIISDLALYQSFLQVNDPWGNLRLYLPFRATQVSMSLDAPDLSRFALSDPGQLAASVPEPSTWALLLFGFAFVALKGIWPGSRV